MIAGDILQRGLSHKTEFPTKREGVVMARGETPLHLGVPEGWSCDVVRAGVPGLPWQV